MVPTILLGFRVRVRAYRPRRVGVGVRVEGEGLTVIVALDQHLIVGGGHDELGDVDHAQGGGSAGTAVTAAGTAGTATSARAASPSGRGEFDPRGQAACACRLWVGQQGDHLCRGHRVREVEG